MTRLLRTIAALGCLLLVSGFGVLVASAPASATSTLLCRGYYGCYQLNMSNSGYRSASATMWWRMYAGHNCTNYVAYRMVKSGLPNVRPWSGSGNASNWGHANARLTDSVPAVGAVAWWDAYVRPAGSAGHLAYVERVVSANEIIVSQDSWGDDFSWARITRDGGSWPSGFVHFNDVALTLRNTTKPTVSGTTTVGLRLTASPGTWSPSGATYAYQWLADGVAIAGANGSGLTLTPAQQDTRISVRTTASKPGYRAATAVSTSTPAVAPAQVTGTPDTPRTFTATAQAAPAGAPRLGQTLTFKPGTVAPSDARVTVQWLRAGVPVAGRTGSTYQLTAADLGSRIRTRMTVAKPGYTTLTTTSPATLLVRSASDLKVALTRPAKGRLHIAVTVTAAAVRPVPGRVRVRWRGRVVRELTLRSGATATTLTGLPRGTRFFRIRYIASDKVTAATVSRFVRIL